VKFSWDRYRGASAKLLKDKVKEVQITGPAQVRFVLREPWPDFITFYGTTASGAGWIVPKKYVEKVGDDGFKAAPIGAGPSKVVSFKPGVELVLEAWDGYWRKAPSVGAFSTAPSARRARLPPSRSTRRSGTLSPIGSVPTEKQPRGFNIDPAGKFIVVSGEKSDMLAVYAIEAETGALKAVGRYPTGKGANWVEIVAF